MTDITTRLTDEADQARQDGADEIAQLLDDARAELAALRISDLIKTENCEAGAEAVASLASERAANAALTAEIEALRADAEAYRWLRNEAQNYLVDGLPWCVTGSVYGGCDPVYGADLDAAIKAAIAARSKAC
jgi:hypothetical protein